MTANDSVNLDSPGSNRRVRSCSASSASSPSLKSRNGKAQRKSSSLPSETVEYLKAWMMSPEHVAHPYPTEQEKAQIMADTGIELKQLTNWFVNNRKRYWKPRVEARLQQQAQAQAAAAAAAVSMTHSITPGQEGRETPYIALDMTQPRSALVVQDQDEAPSSLQLSGHQDPTFSSVATTSSPRVARAVSVASSSSSESGNMSDSTENEDDEVFRTESKDEVDEETGIVTRSETINVHILRPTFAEKEVPTIEDVTILPNVPSARIACSFKNVMMSFHFPREMKVQPKKVQSRRDAEVVRVKKHYLKVFLSESSSRVVNKAVSVKRKRAEDEPVERRRSKYEKKNVPAMWRDACHKAVSGYDDALPSLEEAAYLFGFAQ